MLCGLALTAMPVRAEQLFQKPTDGTPKAKLVAGTPNILDFGDGVKVPCNKEAFLTLWEGPAYWLTFGAGRSVMSLKAVGEGRTFAISCMKALLLTLAFKPENLVQVEGHGWRLKQQDVKNYVRGDIELPGKPFYPVTDNGWGAGTADSASSWGDAGTAEQPAGMPIDTLEFKANAFMAYLVMKRDLSLEDVKARAALIVERAKS